MHQAEDNFFVSLCVKDSQKSFYLRTGRINKMCQAAGASFLTKNTILALRTSGPHQGNLTGLLSMEVENSFLNEHLENHNNKPCDNTLISQQFMKRWFYPRVRKVVKKIYLVEIMFNIIPGTLHSIYLILINFR